MIIDLNPIFKKRSLEAMPLADIYKAMGVISQGGIYYGRRFSYTSNDYPMIYFAMRNKEYDLLNVSSYTYYDNNITFLK